jgi:hypothetical protein
MESRSANFGAKLVPSLNGVDLSFINSVTGSVCRAKCSNILQDMSNKFHKKIFLRFTDKILKINYLNIVLVRIF